MRTSRQFRAKKYSRLANHVLGWLIFIAYEMLFITVFTGKKFSFLEWSMPYCINITLFYINSYLILSRFTRQKAWLTFLFFLVEIFSYLVVIIIVTRLTDNDFSFGTHFWTDEKLPILRSVWRGLYFIMLSTAYWFVRKSSQQSIEISNLEIDKLNAIIEKKNTEQNLIKSENAYLKSQINPHLLFNTLNFIYASVFRLSDVASKAVLLLSDIMRYSLAEVSEDGTVLLDNEIVHIKNYIEINSIRMSSVINLLTDFNISDQGVRIIPLVLLTLVENIFIHGDLTTAADNKIEISCVNNVLLYHSRNLKKKANIPGHGIGMKNIITRLDSFYNSKYSLQTDHSGDYYQVNLQIILT